MQESPKGLGAIKTVVIVGYLLLWNGLMLWSFQLNGWQRRIRDPRALAIVSMACFITGLAALGVMHKPRIRGMLMKPGAEPSDIRKNFAVVALVCLLLGTLSLVSLLAKIAF